MTTLRLHDPTRKPPHWMDQLSATQAAVFLRHAKTEVELDAEARPLPKGSPAVCYVFDSLADAEQFCIQKIAQIDHLHCEIYDRRGKLIDPIRTFTSPRHAHHLPNRRSARRKLAIAWILIAISPALFWIDWRSGGNLIFPTLMAFACIVTAIRLLDWGYGELAMVRESEAKRGPTL